jgi:hypothetical protein
VNGGTPTNVNITGSVQVTDIYWNDSRGMTVTRNGAQVEDAVMVYLYNSSYVPKAGDIIVKGLQSFAFDDTSPPQWRQVSKRSKRRFPTLQL